MSKLTLTQSSPGQYALAGELTRFSVAKTSISTPWLEESSQEVTFDLNALTQVDTAGLAWLVSAVSRLKQQNKQLHLTHVPEQLTKLMTLSQVDNIFE